MIFARQEIPPTDLGAVDGCDVKPILAVPPPPRDLRPHIHFGILAGRGDARGEFREADRRPPRHADSSSGTNSAASTLPGRVAVTTRRPPRARSIAKSATSCVWNSRPP